MALALGGIGVGEAKTGYEDDDDFFHLIMFLSFQKVPLTCSWKHGKARASKRRFVKEERVTCNGLSVDQ